MSSQDIHEDAKSGDLEALNALLAIGADVNAKDEDDRTPLHYAALRGHMDVAEFLLANNADVNAKDDDDWTPLHCAADGGQMDVAEAVEQGHAGVVSILVARGADTNVKDGGGYLAWQRAVLSGNAIIADALLTNSGTSEASVISLKKSAGIALANRAVASLNAEIEEINSEHRSVMPQGCAIDPGVYAHRRHVAKLEALQQLQRATNLDSNNQESIKLRRELTSLVEASVNILKLNYPRRWKEMAELTEAVLANSK